MNCRRRLPSRALWALAVAWMRATRINTATLATWSRLRRRSPAARVAAPAAAPPAAPAGGGSKSGAPSGHTFNQTFNMQAFDGDGMAGMSDQIAASVLEALLP